MPEPSISEPAASDRTEPGTWREIIARFDRDLGDVPGEDGDEDVEVDLTGTPAEPVEAGAPPSLDEPMSWELESLTTHDYVPPHSIHDPEHDSWPVETEDGDAVPAWSDDASAGGSAADDTTDSFDDEIGEMLLDQVVPADPWDAESEPDEPDDTDDTRGKFPLDAFIVPAGVQNVSGFGTDDVAQRVALRLDELARQLRDRGFGALGNTDSVDELSRVLAAIVSGYVTRDN